MVRFRGRNDADERQQAKTVAEMRLQNRQRTVSYTHLDVYKRQHLDRGETLDYLKKALDIGFTSIMYDGSVLPL